MINERGGVLRRLLLLGMVAWGGWYGYRHWWPLHNPQSIGGRLESAVNQELTRLGITDRDIVSHLNRERGRWGFKWVETQRSLRVSDPRRVEEISQGLDRVAQRLGCRARRAESSDGLTITISQYFLNFQHLTMSAAPSLQKPATRATGPQVAFVIDDVAYETVSMDRFASLGVPLTFAILPREKHSGQLARKANALNFPVMLHLPMEPLDMAHNDPGPSGLYLKMSDQALKIQFDKDVASIPNLVGINNHMGSAFTENEPKMTLVLQWVKKRGIYFLDSRTTGKSVVCRVAKHLGVPCLANETFLDNSDDVKSIEIQLDKVLQLALKEGQTIAIGHYRRKYLVQALANKLPEFKSHGVEIVTLPTFYHR